MKLLTPKIANEQGTRDEQHAISRIGYLNETLEKLQARINTEQMNFDQRIQEQRSVYGAEKNALQSEVRDLSAAVATLHTQRKQAMIPVRTLEDEARKKNEEARALLEEAELMRIENEELHLLYQEKIDTASSKEQDLADRDVALSLKEEGVRKEAEMVAAGHKRMNEMMEAFLADVGRRSAELANRESAVSSKEQFVTQTLEEYRRKNAEAERSLRDRQQALERGFEELRTREAELKVVH